MLRDFTKFPDDENGDVLWRMHSSGDNLAKIREINFSVAFPTEQQALDFAVAILQAGHKVQLQLFPEQPDGLTWDVTVSTHIAPTHLEVSDFEQFLADKAVDLGGKNDGWGSFAQP